MCGIAGFFQRQPDDRMGEPLLRAMLGRIAHRGPDHEGLRVRDTEAGLIGLGCRRLVIVDPSERSNQPLANERNTVALVFNGEIYNFRELRAELKALGHVFRSDGDAETIVHAYEQWGTDCVNRLNGMWAFALWDDEKERLFCSRDRFGIKPFYYAESDARFVFASEIKAIVPALPEPAQPDLSTIAEFLLTSDSCHRAETFYRGIRSLPAAHSLLVTREGSEIRRYWDYDSVSQSYDDADPAGTVAALILDATRLQTDDRVPMGLALSGGLDSTALLAASGIRETFTSVFPGYAFDEKPYAQSAARHYSANLHCHAYDPANLVADLETVVWHLDYPSAEPQILPRFQLMRLASNHVKVILEGQGADELFGGYPARHLMAAVMSHLKSVSPRSWLEAMRLLHGYFSPLRPALIRPKIRSLVSWRDGPRRKLMRKEGLFEEAFIREQARASPHDCVHSSSDPLTRRLIADHSRDVLPRLLKFGDALSMAASIEARVPFLDHRLVEYVTRLPAAMKIDSTRYKKVLWDSQRDRLPASVLQRRDKVGFVTPVSQWVGSRLDEEILPILRSQRCRERGIFRPEAIDRAAAEARAGQWRPGARLFEALSVELWFRRCIDGAAGASAT